VNFQLDSKPRTVFFTQSSIISHNGCEVVIHSIYTILYIKNALRTAVVCTSCKKAYLLVL